MTLSATITMHPILFSGEMVRAILAGRKTQTRRVIPNRFMLCRTPEDEPEVFIAWCPYGTPGDRLWVRENGWERPERTPKMMREGADTWLLYMYDADDCDHEHLRALGWKRRPSIHMPRWASRITLEVVQVRVERVQNISENDAICEGMLFLGGGADNLDEAPWADPGDPEQHPWRWARGAFCAAWKRINEKHYPWDSNPWVWVIEFKEVLS